MATPATSLSPAEQITTWLYEVFMERVYLQTAEAAAFYGALAQDTPRAQKEQEQGPMRVNLPATKMAEIYAKGGKPWFIRPQETLRLYNSIKAYLEQARENFDQNTTSNRFDDKMMEYLLILENFASWVFDVAKPYLPKDAEGPGRDTLAGFTRRSRPMGRVAKSELEQVQQQVIDARDHVRVVDEMIERRVARTRSGWS